MFKLIVFWVQFNWWRLIMLSETFKKIDRLVLESEHLSDSEKNELIELVNQLKDELDTVSDVYNDHVQSIANFAHSSAHETLSTTSDNELKELSFKGLNQSIRKFEVSHPNLTTVISLISRTLSRLGV